MLLQLFNAMMVSIIFICIGHYIYENYLFNSMQYKRINVYQDVNKLSLKVSDDIKKDISKEKEETKMKNDLKEHIKTML